MLRTIKRPAVVAPPRHFHRSLTYRCLSTQQEHGRRDDTPPAGNKQTSEVKKDELGGESEPLQDRLRKWTIENLRNLRTQMDDFSAMAQLTFSRLGGRLNEVTGYHEIEVLKRLVTENGAPCKSFHGNTYFI